MAEVKNLEEYSKDVAKRAMSQIAYEDKTLLEWAKLITSGEYQRVVKGKWQQIANKNSRGCSECGMAVTREMARLYSFCPYCGAKNENKYP